MKMLLIFKRLRRKVVLSFRDDDIQSAIDGAKWKFLVWEFDQYLRSESKYGDVEKAYEYRDTLRQMASDNGLTIE